MSIKINLRDGKEIQLNPECLGPRYGRMLFNEPHYKLDKAQTSNKGIISKIVAGVGIFVGGGINAYLNGGINYLKAKFFIDRKVTFLPFLVHALIQQTISISLVLSKIGFYSLIGSRSSFEKLKQEKNLSLHSKVRVFVWKNLEKIEDGVALVDKKICDLFKMRTREELRQAAIRSLINTENKNSYKTREVIKIGLIQDGRLAIKNTTLFLASAAITTALGFPLLSSFIFYSAMASLLFSLFGLVALAMKNEFQKRQQITAQS